MKFDRYGEYISMKHIRKAWDDAVDAYLKYDYNTNLLESSLAVDMKREMEEFFMTELNKLNHDICDIVTHMYCEYEELNKQNKLIGSDMEMFNAKTRVLDNTIEDLESSLTTARYYIYLSGMCGFLLGLACLFLVV